MSENHHINDNKKGQPPSGYQKEEAIMEAQDSNVMLALAQKFKNAVKKEPGEK